MGPIHSSMGNRVIYDLGLQRSVRVQAVINGNRWQWPATNSHDLITLKEATLNCPAPDSTMRSFGVHLHQDNILLLRPGIISENLETRLIGIN